MIHTVYIYFNGNNYFQWECTLYLSEMFELLIYVLYTYIIIGNTNKMIKTKKLTQINCLSCLYLIYNIPSIIIRPAYI